MQDPLPENRQHRQHALEGRARAAGEDRDVAGRGAVAAAGHRAVHGGGSLLLDARGEPARLGLIGGAHFQPDLSGREAGNHPVGRFQDRGRDRRRGQAGDDEVHALGERPRRRGAARPPGGEGRHALLVQVAHRESHAVAQQVARQLPPHIPKSDEPNPQCGHAVDLR